MKASNPSNLSHRLGAYMIQTSSLALYFSFISPYLNLETEFLIPEGRPDKGLVFLASSQLKDVLQKFGCKDQNSALSPFETGASFCPPTREAGKFPCPALWSAVEDHKLWHLAPWAFDVHSKKGWCLVHLSLHLCSCLLGQQPDQTPGGSQIW